ncbi:VCBS domain-containing protein [Variovorax sp. Sphag1AA]|uniref:VCBS domain-containing protein n=1 Tax=Variovorax sp. Sphag1AA TaxID=2587027 RepID=UPI00160FCCED|nr:VCBS domain-containing protein [Variovorax sp. Sphag1AA]MBB3180299.1 VCBS repeat-containing protein [Variovorax sp. Sphag1AA]
MQINVASQVPHAFRPQTHALALEPRILFDGAAASAVDQQHHTDPAHPAEAAAPADAARPATTAEPPAAPAQTPVLPATPAPHQLVVVDSRIENRDQLTAQLPADAQLLVVEPGTDGLAAISAALAQMGPVDSIQIFSHGASGQFTLGSRTLSSDNIAASADVLSGWRAELRPGADIQLYGCNVGAGAPGQALVSELAHWTGADVGASNDNTGGAAAGGNWTLEVRAGDIDKPIALSASALATYDGLLADAAPTVTFTSADPVVLLGDNFSFTVNFTNTSTQIGYAPYIDLFFPATGRDGDDGVTFVSATYLGQALQTYTLTFDASGNATHPLWRDANGNQVVVTAASVGMQPGDQMVVVVLPYGSVANDQPVIPINVTAHLSNLADTSFSDGSPNLGIGVRGAFEFGNDSLNNPTQDPTLVGALAPDLVVHPTILTFTRSIDTIEGETTTGPNFPHTLTVTATPAPGQTLDDVVVKQPMPPQVVVTGITPGAGGTITSLTLIDGTVIDGPAEIAVALAAGTYLRDFTVTYPTMSAPTDTQVSFYVAEFDSGGDPVIDPATGNPVNIIIAGATATGSWIPLDPRDLVPPATDIDFSSVGQGTTFIARSLSIHKESSVAVDTGTPGLTPGDTLNYELDLAISDYFAFGEDFFFNGSFIVTDRLGDGQTFTGTPMLTFTFEGVTRTVPVVYTTVANADGTTTLVFDLVATIQAINPTRRAFSGDLADDSIQQGPTTGVLTYQATVGQSYTLPTGAPHPEINEGDPVGNNAEVSATLLDSLLSNTGVVQRDTSSAIGTVPTHNVDIQLTQVNGGAPPSDGELRPGDLVTFRLSYDLVTSDYEQFSLTAYLPQPLLTTAGITWAQGGGAGQWELTGGNTNLGPVLSVSSGPGNSVIFNFGSYAVTATTGSRIELEFTMRVGDQPFADQRSLAVLAQSQQQTSLDHAQLISSDIANITSIAEPVLAIQHGVVSTSHGTVTGTTGTWAAPGTTGPAFTGNITDLTAVDGRVDGIDASDVVRLATALENTGGGGAFDVVTSITLPPGLSFLNGSLAAANLQIRRGDGTLLTAGVDYSVSGNTISFLDANGIASLLPGRAGTAADTSGANMVVITYDTVVSGTIDASRTMQSTATLSNYASVNGGPDFTPTDLTNTADEQVAAPTVIKVFADGTLDNGDSSATHTTGSDLVIGESMLYDIVVTLPEGVTQTLSIDDLLPAGLRLDTTFNGGAGYQIITTTTGSGALGANFNGAVIAGALSGIGGTLGNDGVGAHLTLSSASATGDNDTGNNSFVLRVRLVASNTIANQAGRNLPNNAQLGYTDPDGNVPNGTVPAAVTVALTGSQPTVTVREPTLVITQTTATDPGIGVDEGDTVEFIITITNGSATSDFDAFDIHFLDAIPTELANLQLLSVTYSGGATNNGLPDFALTATQLISVLNSDIDIPTGGSIVLHFSGVVTAQAASQAVIDNPIQLQWTSLNGTTSSPTADPAGERTGADGVLGSGVLNDYQRLSNLLVPVAQAIRISRVGGLPETPAPDPTNAPVEQVTIGEIIRYRVAVLVPEGQNPNYEVRITLPAGLDFIDPDALVNTVRLALVSNGGLTSDAANLIVGGTLAVSGDENSPVALYITPDLSGPAPDGVFNPARITVSPDGRTISFSLGNLTNAENDVNLEGVVFEFNVRVTNEAVNQSTSPLLGVSAHEFVNNLARANSETVSERIVEPGFSGVDKRVIGFDPNPAAATGTATVQLSFTNNGGSPAFDTHLADAIPGGSNYTLVGVVIDGITYAPGTLPTGVTVDTTNGISADFAQLNNGQSVRLIYSVTLPNTAAIAISNATLTWTSLPDSFTDWGGSAVGTAGTTDGERTGADGTVGSGVLNDYRLTEGAGLGVISGTLWNDTSSATSSTTPDGPGLPGQTVTLTWGGVDNNLSTTADNLTFTTTTDINGRYQFGLLPAGSFRIDTPTGTITYSQPIGDLRVRIDTDGGTLGQILVTLGEAQTTQANAGYVEQNDAPVNHMPASVPDGFEDIPLEVHGITVSDIDVDRDPDPAGRTLQITLSVTNGTLFLSSAQAGVTVTGANTGTMVLTGTVADLNAALDKLMYLGRRDFNGTDTLTVLTNDLGNFGDHNSNGIPGELADALTDQDSIVLTLEPVNDAPIANPDTADALEAGGTRNQQFGVDPRGGLLGNDTDVDIETNGDILTVTQIGLSGTPLIPVVRLTVAQGLYGRLVVNENGIYQYIVDNSNPAVEALRTADQTLVERFNYVISDLGGLTSSSTLTVTIHGANDAPVGVDDTGTAIEAGGVANGTPGADATGNVLTNDTDVDSVANGETRQVTGIRTVPQDVPGPVTPVALGSSSTNGTLIAGLYGTLSIGADGTYRYVVNNADPTVQRLSVGETLTETFSYRVTDRAGLDDVANLVIVIQGRNDNPVASDDLAHATAGSNDGTPAAIPATGNVITDASRPGTADQPGGNGIDQDVDSADNPNTVLQVNGIRQGAEAAGGTLTAVGGATTIAGLYGQITINPDGSFTYNVDNINATVQALPPGATIDDVFTYRIIDTQGAPDTAQIVVRITGVNDAPIAGTLTVDAIEASGVFNGTPGVDPSSNIHIVVSDPDGEVPLVTSIQDPITGSTFPVSGPTRTNILTPLGTLTIGADGGLTFTVNNSSPIVEALRTDSDRLTMNFAFTVTDSGGKSAVGTVTVVIHGRNDNPVAVDDGVDAIEAGGTFNATPGLDPSGNLLTNDTDVDAGDTRTLTAIRTGTEAAGGTFTAVAAAGQVIRGQYGTLTVRPDGSYDYAVDNTLAAVQALRQGDTLNDVFSYTMVDTAGAPDIAQFAVTIHGAWDAPVANDDLAFSVADNGLGISINPTSNVLPNDTDVDRPDLLHVSGIRAGQEAAGGALQPVATGTTNTNGTVINGLYGQLVIGSDGRYTYTVDPNNPDVQALGLLQLAHDYFTYQATDLGGLSDLAQIHIVIIGLNDAPNAFPDDAAAVEAGGLHNNQPGVDPRGNVITNDTDAENDPLTVTQVRTGGLAVSGTAGTVGSVLRGQYGDLTLNADGSYTYLVDNSLPAVEALRTSGQTLTDTFTYTIRDIWFATSSAELRITIDGRNDTPIANDDNTVSVEAGGIANQTPGLNPTGNVLPNDTDVDSVANGETQRVVTVTSPTGVTADAGQVLTGLYGSLTLNADGSYTYVLDNTNPTVQALRTADETITEHFTYVMRDTAGATSQARFDVLIRGANDNPVAADDSNVASSEIPAPNATGNVLPNDTDVDGGDSLHVVGIRTGPEAGTGTTGSVGQSIAGRYGTLVLNADGSYTYTIDQTNPDVLAAAGLGQVLRDTFTYTVADRAGATDTAQLVISLDVAAPYIPPPPYFNTLASETRTDQPLPDVRPMVYVTPVVRQANTVLSLSAWGADGSEFWWQLPQEIRSTSLGGGLGEVPGQYVSRAVAISRDESQLDLAWVNGRESRISLSADGLLENPSLFTVDPDRMTTSPPAEPPPAQQPTAQGFSEQLRDAALRLNPLGAALAANAGSPPL